MCRIIGANVLSPGTLLSNQPARSLPLSAFVPNGPAQINPSNQQQLNQPAMFSTKNCILASIALTAATVNAHGNLALPAPTFSGYGGGFSAVIPSSVLTEPSGMHFNWGPDSNADAFDTAFKAAKESSLKDFILKNQDTTQASGTILSKECGYSNPAGTPQALPAEIQWAGGNFIHPGPCEAWCDDEIVVPYTANCWKTFSTGMVPYEKAKCSGKKQLTFYWLAVHSPPWQVYINCVPLSGANASGSSSSTTPTVTTKAPAASTTTKTPAASITTKAPAATTSTPVASDATPAPAAGKKCKRKLKVIA